MNFNNENLNDYFLSLPSFIQESIVQSGITFTDAETLMQFVKKIEKDKQ